jgi:hypothetical protein
MVVGALVTGAGLHVAGGLTGRPPLAALGAVSLGCAGLGAAGASALQLGRRWRVPRSWAGMGPTVYAGLFGGALGLGFATALPSLGFLALAFASLTVGSWEVVCVAFVAFGVARALPLVVVYAAGGGERASRQVMEGIGTAAASLVPAEVLLLTLLGVACLR